MASSAHIFFAGVGTTFVILGMGFGGGLLMANSALKEPTGYQARAKAEPSLPVRVILPASAEAAQPPQPPQEAPQQTAAVEPAPEPVKVVQQEKRAEKVDTKKAEVEVRERRKRYAERKARREAARAKQQLEPRERQAPIMAFGSDESQRGLGLFGNN
jgi:hypothetical protein